MKKTIAFILLLLIASSSFTADKNTASSQEKAFALAKEPPHSSFKYELTDDLEGVRITEYHGDDIHILIPEKIEEMSVRELGGSLFSRKDNIEKRGEAISGTFKLLKSFEGKTFAITEAALTLCNFLMLGISAFLLVSGKIDFAAFLISNLMLLSGYGPIIAVSGLAVNLQQTFASAERVFSLLEEKPELDEVTDGENLSFEKVDADNINFRYDDMEVLQDVSISVKKDEIVGLCGKSGSGKSTLLRLIMRFFDPLSGEVKMSGIDIKKINTASLREAVSYITQQTYIFKKSIYENILLANRNASKEDVIEAAKKAAIHDFIMSLPEGYDTKMTELGGNLSSGEKQRLGLARAFLHKAPLLLLDEPTGNLDSLNEALILNSIYQEKKDKGVLIVSHRKSTVNAADKIVYIEKGRVR